MFKKEITCKKIKLNCNNMNHLKHQHQIFWMISWYLKDDFWNEIKSFALTKFRFVGLFFFPNSRPTKLCDGFFFFLLFINAPDRKHFCLLTVFVSHEGKSVGQISQMLLISAGKRHQRHSLMWLATLLRASFLHIWWQIDSDGSHYAKIQWLHLPYISERVWLSMK